MKYCRNCGAPITPGSRFCTKCGAKLEEDTAPAGQPQPIPQPQSQAQQNPYTSQQAPYQQPQYQQPRPKKPVNKPLIIGIIVAVAVVLAVIFVLIYVHNSYNLQDYVKVKFTGYQGYGYVDAETRDDKLEERIGRKFGYSEKDLDDYDSLSELGTDVKKALQVENFVESVEPEVKGAKQGSLSNGDTVKIKVSYSKAYAKKLGIHIHGDTFTVTVDGLKKGDVTDPFKSVSIVYSGALPYLIPSVSVDENSDFYEDEFVITADGQSSDDGTVILTDKGEEFTVTYTGDDDPENGLILARKKKKYVVGNVSSYLTKASELTDDDRKQLIGRTVKLNNDNGMDFDKLRFIGCATGITSEYGGYPHEEQTVAVYSYQDEDWWSEDKVTRYMTVSFPSTMRQSDGTLWFNDDEVTYMYGFEDLDEATNSLNGSEFTYDGDKTIMG